MKSKHKNLILGDIAKQEVILHSTPICNYFSTWLIYSTTPKSQGMRTICTCKAQKAYCSLGNLLQYFSAAMRFCLARYDSKLKIKFDNNPWQSAEGQTEARRQETLTTISRTTNVEGPKNKIRKNTLFIKKIRKC